MRAMLVVGLCLLASACIEPGPEPQPSEFELSWAKRGVAYDNFVADVDACNARADTVAETVPQRRGNPENDLFPPIMLWRWVLHGYDVDAAMAQSYRDCFEPRGYRLIFVPVADANTLHDITFAPYDEALSVRERRAIIREQQLRLLYAWAMDPHPRRAHVETRVQRRHLVAQVLPTSP